MSLENLMHKRVQCIYGDYVLTALVVDYGGGQYHNWEYEKTWITVEDSNGKTFTIHEEDIIAVVG